MPWRAAAEYLELVNIGARSCSFSGTAITLKQETTGEMGEIGAQEPHAIGKILTDRSEGLLVSTLCYSICLEGSARRRRHVSLLNLWPLFLFSFSP